MDRRSFLRSTAAASGLALLGSARFMSEAEASTESVYGPLAPPDTNGISLPAGFTSRLIARTGEPVANTGYLWHPNPDGGATFSTADGGWTYVSNDESSNGAGGASMIGFDADGNIVDARRILGGTSRNCAGGITPWGTWLSCEETFDGLVWEVDPTGTEAPKAHPGMGRFNHETAAIDPVGELIYLTEDRGDGGLYRFRPNDWGDLSAGTLEVMTEVDGVTGWAVVPDPAGTTIDTRKQVPTMRPFRGGEGAWFQGNCLYFTTKIDNIVWRYSTYDQSLDAIYDIAAASSPVLKGVDALTMAPSGELFVCEDGGNMELIVLAEDGTLGPFLQLSTAFSELTGVAFSPDGARLYFSSQRNPGETFEVTGPFNPPLIVAREMDAAVSLSVSLVEDSLYKGEALVTVVGDRGFGHAGVIGGATVVGEWRKNGRLLKTDAVVTDATGSALFTKWQTKIQPGQRLRFKVVDLQYPDSIWHPEYLPGRAARRWRRPKNS